MALKHPETQSPGEFIASALNSPGLSVFIALSGRLELRRDGLHDEVEFVIAVRNHVLRQWDGAPAVDTR